jgi:hypothetical protein
MVSGDRVEDVRLAVFDRFRRTGRSPGEAELADG